MLKCLQRTSHTFHTAHWCTFNNCHLRALMYHQPKQTHTSLWALKAEEHNKLAQRHKREPGESTNSLYILFSDVNISHSGEKYIKNVILCVFMHSAHVLFTHFSHPDFFQTFVSRLKTTVQHNTC